ncbi:uncharacterized protein [Amphiura filiformis]|uniref:uncharacterized protein n=1 Tax=Amphiura filiformis TaxID=82378 RepID=UPI003B21AAF3
MPIDQTNNMADTSFSSHKCPECNKIFPKRPWLDHHRISCHPANPPKGAEVHPANPPNGAEVHTTRAEGEGHPTDATNHQSQLIKPKLVKVLYKCAECLLVSSSFDDVKQHLLMFHQEVSPSKSVDIIETKRMYGLQREETKKTTASKSPRKGFRVGCPFCYKDNHKYRSLWHLQKHMSAKHKRTASSTSIPSLTHDHQYFFPSAGKQSSKPSEERTFSLTERSEESLTAGLPPPLHTLQQASKPSEERTLSLMERSEESLTAGLPPPLHTLQQASKPLEERTLSSTERSEESLTTVAPPSFHMLQQTSKSSEEKSLSSAESSEENLTTYFLVPPLEQATFKPSEERTPTLIAESEENFTNLLPPLKKGSEPLEEKTLSSTERSEENLTIDLPPTIHWSSTPLEESTPSLTERSEETNMTDSSALLRCPLCTDGSPVFKDSHELSVHSLSKHSPRVLLTKYKASEDSEQLSTPKRLKIYLWKCLKCAAGGHNKIFKSYMDLNKHISSHNTLACTKDATSEKATKVDEDTEHGVKIPCSPENQMKKATKVDEETVHGVKIPCSPLDVQLINSASNETHGPETVLNNEDNSEDSLPEVQLYASNENIDCVSRVTEKNATKEAVNDNDNESPDSPPEVQLYTMEDQCHVSCSQGDESIHIGADTQQIAHDPLVLNGGQLSVQTSEISDGFSNAVVGTKTKTEEPDPMLNGEGREGSSVESGGKNKTTELDLQMFVNGENREGSSAESGAKNQGIEVDFESSESGGKNKTMEVVLDNLLDGEKRVVHGGGDRDSSSGVKIKTGTSDSGHLLIDGEKMSYTEDEGDNKDKGDIEAVDRLPVLDVMLKLLADIGKDDEKKCDGNEGLEDPRRSEVQSVEYDDDRLEGSFCNISGIEDHSMEETETMNASNDTHVADVVEDNYIADVQSNEQTCQDSFELEEIPEVEVHVQVKVYEAIPSIADEEMDVRNRNFDGTFSLGAEEIVVQNGYIDGYSSISAEENGTQLNASKNTDDPYVLSECCGSVEHKGNSCNEDLCSEGRCTLKDVELTSQETDFAEVNRACDVINDKPHDTMPEDNEAYDTLNDDTPHGTNPEDNKAYDTLSDTPHDTGPDDSKACGTRNGTPHDTEPEDSKAYDTPSDTPHGTKPEENEAYDTPSDDTEPEDNTAYDTPSDTPNVENSHYTFQENSFRDQLAMIQESPVSAGYKCRICNVRFSKDVLPLVHMRSHVRKHNYHCNLCKFKSSFKSPMLRHLESNHKVCHPRGAKTMLTFPRQDVASGGKSGQSNMTERKRDEDVQKKRVEAKKRVSNSEASTSSSAKRWCHKEKALLKSISSNDCVEFAKFAPLKSRRKDHIPRRVDVNLEMAEFGDDDDDDEGSLCDDDHSKDMDVDGGEDVASDLVMDVGDPTSIAGQAVIESRLTDASSEKDVTMVTDVPDSTIELEFPINHPSVEQVIRDVPEGTVNSRGADHCQSHSADVETIMLTVSSKEASSAQNVYLRRIVEGLCIQTNDCAFLPSIEAQQCLLEVCDPMSKLPRRCDKEPCIRAGKGTMYRSLQTLYQHVLYHGSECPYLCKHCKYRTRSMTFLTNHMKAAHLSDLSVNWALPSVDYLNYLPTKWYPIDRSYSSVTRPVELVNSSSSAAMRSPDSQTSERAHAERLGNNSSSAVVRYPDSQTRERVHADKPVSSSSSAVVRHPDSQTRERAHADKPVNSSSSAVVRLPNSQTSERSHSDKPVSSSSSAVVRHPDSQTRERAHADKPLNSSSSALVRHPDSQTRERAHAEKPVNSSSSAVIRHPDSQISERSHSDKPVSSSSSAVVRHPDSQTRERAHADKPLNSSSSALVRHPDSQTRERAHAEKPVNSSSSAVIRHPDSQISERSHSDKPVSSSSSAVLKGPDPQTSERSPAVKPVNVPDKARHRQKYVQRVEYIYSPSYAEKELCWFIHSLSAKTSPDLRMRCKFCSRQDSIHNMPLHQRRAHEQSKPFSCCRCKFRCDMVGDMITHIKSHKELTRELCDVFHICNLQNQVYHQVYMKPSYRMLTGTQVYHCNACKYTTFALQQMQRHVQANHKVILGLEKNPFDGQYLCNMCNRAWSDQTEAIDHKCITIGCMLEQAGIGNQKPTKADSTSSTIICKLCPFSAKTTAAMRVHNVLIHGHKQTVTNQQIQSAQVDQREMPDDLQSIDSQLQCTDNLLSPTTHLTQSEGGRQPSVGKSNPVVMTNCMRSEVGPQSSGSDNTSLSQTWSNDHDPSTSSHQEAQSMRAENDQQSPKSQGDTLLSYLRAQATKSDQSNGDLHKQPVNSELKQLLTSAKNDRFSTTSQLTQSTQQPSTRPVYQHQNRPANQPTRQWDGPLSPISEPVQSVQSINGQTQPSNIILCQPSAESYQPVDGYQGTPFISPSKPPLPPPYTQAIYERYHPYMMPTRIPLLRGQTHPSNIHHQQQQYPYPAIPVGSPNWNPMGPARPTVNVQHSNGTNQQNFSTQFPAAYQDGAYLPPVNLLQQQQQQNWYQQQQQQQQKRPYPMAQGYQRRGATRVFTSNSVRQSTVSKSGPALPEIRLPPSPVRLIDSASPPGQILTSVTNNLTQILRGTATRLPSGVQKAMTHPVPDDDSSAPSGPLVMTGMIAAIKSNPGRYTENDQAVSAALDFSRSSIARGISMHQSASNEQTNKHRTEQTTSSQPKMLPQTLIPKGADNSETNNLPNHTRDGSGKSTLPGGSCDGKGDSYEEEDDNFLDWMLHSPSADAPTITPLNELNFDQDDLNASSSFSLSQDQSQDNRGVEDSHVPLSSHLSHDQSQDTQGLQDSNGHEHVAAGTETSSSHQEQVEELESPAKLDDDAGALQSDATPIVAHVVSIKNGLCKKVGIGRPC